VNLRHKFGILALIYVLSLCANLVMSGWCIVAYFQTAFVDVRSSFVRQAEIERLRVRLQGARERMRLYGDALAPARWQQEIQGLITAGALPAPDGSGASWDAALEQSLAQALADPSEDALERCDHELGKISTAITRRRQTAIDNASSTQQKVVSILIGNSVFGALLCLVGLILVRRWVLLPVADLRAATQQLARGRFDHRVEPRSGDELGRLGGEVNQMAGTIVNMQAKLVEQERQAAAGEMFIRIAHNIRNPLAGIRGLAEATGQPGVGPDEVGEYQRRIIKSIDHLEKWLRDLQHSVAPLTIEPRHTDMVELVESVRSVLEPMAERAGVRILVTIDPVTRYVTVDGFQFEQALVALITNAVQASQRDQAVRVHVGPAAADPNLDAEPGAWMVTVEDDGEGIPEALRGKVFLPNFTTRREGQGIGLTLAAKVVQTHGGRLTLDSTPGIGSRFAAIMPAGPAVDSKRHG
jgi:signal transduction histidine kinase